MCELRAAQRLVVTPFQQIMVRMCTNEYMSTSRGTVEATPSVTQKVALIVASAISENNKTVNRITNWTDHTYTINPSALLANIAVLTPNQTINVKPMPLEQLNLINQFLEGASQVLHQLFQELTYSEDKKVPNSRHVH